MSGPLRFEIDAVSASTQARVGRVHTPHGSFATPAFMPVGTRASVKGLMPEQVRATGAEIILNNAFHLMLRPGDDLIGSLGGVHEFMRWDGPILTDSGGFQAWSLADTNTLNDDGITFKSMIDGSRIHLTPERAIEVQNNLGADIIMAFDDCPPSVDSSERLRERRPELAEAHERQVGEDHHRRLASAVDRTAQWLERCVAAHGRRDEQALFGIVQGGPNEALRRRSAELVTAFDLPGYAIGGVAVGESPHAIATTVAMTAPLLPQDRPRYLMGVGYERDLVSAVRAGVDMFDCVLPTRNGRNGGIFTPHGRLQIRNARFREDLSPLVEGCDCEACSGGFSRAYLRHLFIAGEMLGPILLSLHNIRHFERLMVDIRRAIRDDAWSSLAQAWPVLDVPAVAAPGSTGGSA
ncbi:MAG: tRNA guanosine(34) transglycosylase Tgt [Planctomycetes bacterium]|nr:tRNA guanosine(34) transglycosylase Tgt [Planctomycetota bacterium]MCP4838699.1 tRNA guanosine(34) transglycosylase Tgt [Planctomycetota bacterium]